MSSGAIRPTDPSVAVTAAQPTATTIARSPGVAMAGLKLGTDAVSPGAKAGGATPVLPLATPKERPVARLGSLIASGTSIVTGARVLRITQPLRLISQDLHSAGNSVASASIAHQISIKRIGYATKDVTDQQAQLLETETAIKRFDALAVSRPDTPSSTSDMMRQKLHVADLPKTRQGQLKGLEYYKGQLAVEKTQLRATGQRLTNVRARVDLYQSQKAQLIRSSASPVIGLMAIVGGSLESATAVSQFRKGEVRSGVAHSLAAMGQYALAVPQLAMGTVVRNVPKLAPQMMRLGVVGAVVATTGAVATLFTD
ncbi:MAG: hypothetical protein H7338_18695 [Candidatus Sericytochromatia bacterium]|nr:hypothetical protein [Candidatus Sericytochromatia bacterium]